MRLTKTKTGFSLSLTADQAHQLGTVLNFAPVCDALKSTFSSESELSEAHKLFSAKGFNVSKDNSRFAHAILATPWFAFRKSK